MFQHSAVAIFVPRPCDDGIDCAWRVPNVILRPHHHQFPLTSVAMVTSLVELPLFAKAGT